MAWRLEPGKPLVDEFTRVALEETNRARALLTSPDLPEDQAIHQARRSFKRIRALVRLAKPSLGVCYVRENRRWRDAGRLLSASRDATVLLGTFDRIVEPAELSLASMAALRKRLEQPEPTGRTQAHQSLGEQRSEVLACVEEALHAIPGLDWPNNSSDLGRGLRDSQSRLKRSWKAAKRDSSDAGSEALHDWRKRVKDTASHFGLLRAVLPPEFKAAREDAKTLARLLGEEHDLMLLGQRLSEARVPKAWRASAAAVLRSIEERRGELRAAAFEKGEALSSRAPKELVREVAGGWNDPVAPGQRAAAQAGRGNR